MALTRRSFVSSTLGVAVIGGAMPLGLARAANADPLPALGTSLDPDNVLVVIQMGGGNDGLNTVVPYSDDAYHRVRATIGIPPASVLKLNDRIGFNPALKGLNELYKGGRVAVVQAVGYENPNRSHFEATRIWETASPVRPQQYGWLGRLLDKQYGATKIGMFDAVALGDTLPAALVGARVEVPAIGALGAYGYNTGRDLAEKSSAGVLYDGARPGQSPYLHMIADTSREAYHGGDRLRADTATYTPGAGVVYPKDGFSQQMMLAARLITSKTATRVVWVSLGSFDTHAGQRAQQDRLLGYLGDGLKAFYDDLAAHGMAERVLTMTFSEFGRRVQQNASNGTDHGTAMPLFMVGGRVRGGVYGEHPSLTSLDRNGDLVYATDFRAVYSTVIAKWLGRNPSDVLDAQYPTLAFV